VTVLGCKACCAKHKCTYLLTYYNELHRLIRCGTVDAAYSQSCGLLSDMFVIFGGGFEMPPNIKHVYSATRAISLHDVKPDFTR